MAQEALRDLFVEDNTLRLSIPVVQKVVADYYQISVEDLKSTRKNRDIAFPRQIAMYLCHEMMGCTTTQIGREFGNRHHTTVMHARDLISEQRMTNSSLDQTIREIEKLIKKR